VNITVICWRLSYMEVGYNPSGGFSTPGWLATPICSLIKPLEKDSIIAISFPGPLRPQRS